MNKVTSADGTPIAYERSGDGPPVIMVGGALNDRGSAVPLAESLTPHFSVVRYDRRGRGDSGDTLPYDVVREIEDLAALISEIGGAPSVYGLSSGAVLALRAAEAGLPISRLALYEAPFAPDDDATRKNAQQYAAALKALLTQDRRADAVAEFMTLVGIPAEMITQMRHAPMFPALEALAHTLAYDSDVMGDSTAGSAIPVDLVGAVTAPTLALYGEASPEWMKDTARRLSELLPHGRLAGLHGQTHDVAPDVLAPVLVEFFSA